MQVEVVTRRPRLEELNESWSELWHRCEAATPFQSPAWLIPWWRAFEPGQLRTIAVWDEYRLIALAPLYVEETDQRRGLPLGIGCSDYCDILLPGTDDVIRDALCEAMARLDVRSVEYPDLSVGSSALGLPRVPGLRRITLPGEPRPALNLDVAEPLSSVPAGQRRKLRMACHRAERAGGLRIEIVAPGCTGSFLDRLCRLHGRRWAQRGETGVLADPRIQAFQAEAVPLLQQAGLLRAALAWIGEDLAGAYYGLGTRSTAYAYLGGFEPSASYASPGTILLGWAIEEAAGSGATAFDFLRGREPYKYRWGAADRPSWILRFEGRS
jgi:CelD/BcsL family acetyltransferase involved in cellulose biosynthesis